MEIVIAEHSAMTISTAASRAGPGRARGPSSGCDEPPTNVTPPPPRRPPPPPPPAEQPGRQQTLPHPSHSSVDTAIISGCPTSESV